MQRASATTSGVGNTHRSSIGVPKRLTSRERM
jgi:hypothetical protein